jgi:hypothetical protein
VLRKLIALTAAAGAVVLAGWAAVGSVVGFDFGAPERQAEPAAVQVAHADIPDNAGAADVRAAARAQEPRAPGIYGWHSSLVAPQATLPELLGPPQILAPQPEAAPAPAIEPPQRAAPAAPAEPRKGRRKADSYDGGLTVEQVADIKRRLRLTAEQEEHWKPVEAALLRMARQHARSGRKIVLDANESMQLYLAAGPLVMSLREDQKNEARRLARAMGLESVAELL